MMMTMMMDHTKREGKTNNNHFYTQRKSLVIDVR